DFSKARLWPAPAPEPVLPERLGRRHAVRSCLSRPACTRPSARAAGSARPGTGASAPSEKRSGLTRHPTAPAAQDPGKHRLFDGGVGDLAVGEAQFAGGVHIGQKLVANHLDGLTVELIAIRKAWYAAAWPSDADRDTPSTHGRLPVGPRRGASAGKDAA